ncbi:Branched-chain amino acid ABC-type transport system, permease component [Candidatus Rhodobacter oscarellae]|uniref:Branched-chain amino acid ABC-type transport system, permease component n=1 Tax=Candidatus Rhodobacter oscarellae TaxID=1675527 RepID=A0A0J9EB54_9RHOB|nr:hypothetical protein [Candidatus Rhodobacter lobularis]KMW58914.1 Branched-chain amino acid ABC-type transport system, permease component [Candidatus Rhodobacter lobularis]
MIERKDLQAAVSAGIVTESQAASLAALADSRRGARENLAPGDEPFELFKGFNEIFIVVGLVILAMGWIAVTGVSIGTNLGGTMGRITLYAVIGAGVLWALAEYFIRRRRMVAPAIALTVLFAGNAAAGLNAWLAQPFMVMQNDLTSIPLPLLLTTAAVFVFWFRFRVPVALAFVALGLFAAAVVQSAAGGEAPGDLRDFFLLSAGSNFAWLTLALGVATFAVAMMFDMSDPHRVTRRAANGFWLHVIAAPAIVNTIALTLLSSDSAGAMGLLIAFLGLIALIAMIIDRRSFLITGVGYVVAVATTVGDAGGTAMAILILGITLLMLGAFWERIRAVLLRGLAPFLPLSKLPPTA